MRLHLTRDFDGSFALSRLVPVASRVRSTRRQALYPTPGDLVWLPRLCREGVQAMFGDAAMELQPGESWLVEMAGTRVET